MHTGLCSSLIGVVFLAVLSQGQIQFPGGGGGGGGSRFPRPRPQPQSQRPVPPKAQEQSEQKGCNCLPKSQCPKGFGQLSTVCLSEGGDQGICCIPQEGVVLTRVGFSQDVAPSNIPNNIIQQGVDLGKKSFQTFLQQEQDRRRNRRYLPRGEPARGHAYFFQRDPSAQAVNDLALTIAKSSIEIANMQNLDAQQSFSSLPEVRIGGNRITGLECPLNPPRCDANSKYRTIDGSCNNLRRPLRGKSETGFTRLGPHLYADGIMEPRENGVDGQPLPNPRTASSNILIDVDAPDRALALGVMQFAQFMDHDLTLTPFDDMDGEAIMCCENGRVVSPMPESCFPILIPSSDGFYGPRGQGCINFVRSMLALNEDCAFGPVEQQNVLTQWVDGSMIYGSTEDQKHNVADLSTGFLRTSANNLPPLNRTLDCEARISGSVCFVGGDSRISEQPALTTMHTIWIREHNRIAAILKRLNPHWRPNQLYEETRRIVIAQVQHIVYSEWLPIIIGPSLMNKLGINVLRNGYRNSYDPSLDARIANEFATAAFRFGHSLVQGIYRVISETGRQSTIRLRDSFNAPHLIQNNPELVDGFVNALTLQNIQTLDSHITQELSNHLFQTPRFNFGMDLMSLNLQRARDHAISTYNAMRQLFGLGRARTFIDLQNTTPDDLIKRIQSVYRSVDDIDLFIGGMTERSLPDGILGPTFANIVGRQFQVAMNGDRYFYDMANQAGSFTPAQLQELRKASIARVYCDNSNVKEMQPLAFEGVSRNNPRVPCDGGRIPQINLEVFKE